MINFNCFLKIGWPFVINLNQCNGILFEQHLLQVFVVSVISVLRCIVSMTVNASVEAGDIADKVSH